MATQLYDENNVPHWVKDIKRVQPMIQSGKFFFEPQTKEPGAEVIEGEAELTEEETIEMPVEQEQTHRRGRRKQR